MSSNVEFNIRAFDEASTFFSVVQATAEECLSTIESDASEMTTNLETTASVQSDIQNVTAAAQEMQAAPTKVTVTAQDMASPVLADVKKNESTA